MSKDRRTHAENVAAMDRRPVDTSRSNSKTHQQTMELVQCLQKWWRGDKSEFSQFSARYLTAKGEAMADAIDSQSSEDTLYAQAAAAVTAGY